MGNKLGRRKQVVDEKYTKPQGLYNHKDVDQKKLRKLILESKLAPCYPGDEECTHDLEECPICFLYYPSLNRSRCCTKSICTECFLLMKVPNATRPTQCPFCKTENYGVEYRGRKTKEEKGLEQMEEQRVIEAKIRIRQQELQEEEERMHKRQEKISSSGNVAPADVEYSSNAVSTTASVSVVEDEEIFSAQNSGAKPIIGPPPAPRTNRDADFDLDLEEIMVMEAIWLSIQESGRQRNISYPDSPSGQYTPDDHNVSSAVGVVQSGSSSSPSGGLACALAALAERQQMAEESSMSSTNGNISSFYTLQDTSMFSNRLYRDSYSYPPADNINDVPADGTRTMTRSHGEWDMDHGPDTAESATHYADSAAVDDGGSLLSLPKPDDIEGGLEIATDPVTPESFEEQVMLAMAVPFAKARAMSSG